MKPETQTLASLLANIAPDVQILSDEGWGEGQRGGRCITDFSRQVNFSRVLSFEELQSIKKFMAEDGHCPGWTGVSGYLMKDTQHTYQFSTTWDSSD